MNRLMNEITWKLLSDERFANLCLAADKGVLTFADLDAYEMPEGASKEEVWNLLEMTRMLTSYDPLSSKLYQGKMEWIGTTSAIVSASADLEFRCQSGSLLDISLAPFKGSPIMSKNLEAQLLYMFRIEGITATPERIHKAFLGEGEPADSLDKVCRNFFGICAEIPMLASRDISPGFIEFLHYRLLHGVNAEDIPPRKNQNRYWSSSADARDCIDYVCENAKLRRDGEAFIPIMLRLLLTTWIFFDFEVFPCLNALVGILARNVIAHKWGYPLITWIPMGYLPYKDDDTEARALYDSLRRDFKREDASQGDLTNCALMHLEYWIKELEGLESIAARMPKLNEAIEKLFDFPMNERQRAVLSAVCKNPAKRIRIEEHRRHYGIAYSTARGDLFELVEVGYLSQAKCGRAFEFQISPEFKRRIAYVEEAVVGYLGTK